MTDHDFAFLKELLEAPSPSGYEAPARNLLRRKLESVADHLEVDMLGNLIVSLIGEGEGRPRLMLTAHYDEIGFLIRYIDDRGFLYFAPVAVHHPITPSNYMRGMSDCGPYGDFIQDLDWSVARIIQTLEYKGLLENSIIIFTSDNGGEIPGNKPEAPEIQAINMGLKINGDLRGDKHTIWEGGTRIPFIVSWPGKVKEGTVSEDVIAIMDVFATVADLTGNGLPEDKNVAPDSRSFISSLKGEEKDTGRKSVVTADMYGMQAVRMGDWKYIDNTLPVELPESRRKNIAVPLKQQLYNLAEDPGERNNLFDKNPEVVIMLIHELQRIRNQESTR